MNNLFRFHLSGVKIRYKKSPRQNKICKKLNSTQSKVITKEIFWRFGKTYKLITIFIIREFFFTLVFFHTLYQNPR